MAVFNYSTRELTTKIVYYGPGLCGKTTNLQFVYDHLAQGVRGKMLSLATKTDRTLFFDFLPIDLGNIQGMKTKVQLYTVPGQVFYNETRRLVLKGADGLVFVADSQDSVLDANVDSFKNLEENLSAHGMKLEEIPHVLQFNKQDLPNATNVDVLNERLNRYNAPFYEAIATTGVGVQETLRHVCKLVLIRLSEKYSAGRPGAAAAADERPAAGAAVSSVAAAGSLADEGLGNVDVEEQLGMPPAPDSPQPALAQEAPEMAAADKGSFEMPLPRDREEDFESDDIASDGYDAPGLGAYDDEDVFGLISETPPLDPDKTLKLEEATVAEALGAGAAAQELARETTPAATAVASAVEVTSDDPLFQEPGLEATRLEEGEPQEILVPLEVMTASGVKRFRLTIRLEAPVGVHA